MIVAIHQAGSAQHRHRLLQQIASLLSDENFPAIIKLFLIVGESDDQFAKNTLAEALADTLVRGDIPSAPLAAWGSDSLERAAPGAGFSAGVRLDPLQYLCAWYGQRDTRTAISAQNFKRAVAAMLAIFSQRPEAAEQYRVKLRADLQNAQDGALDSSTRQLLGQIVGEWERGDLPTAIADRAAGGKKPGMNIADLARAQILARTVPAPKPPPTEK